MIGHVSEEWSGCKNVLSRGVDEVGKADRLGVNGLRGIRAWGTELGHKRRSQD